MKICLINPLCQTSLWENEIASHEPPLGLAYIAAFLEKYGHKVTILERRRIIGNKRRTEENLKELDARTSVYIKTFQPDIVGITATTPLIMDAYRTAKIIKDISPDLKTMIGGCHPTAEPERTLIDCPEIDALCIGEGELTFLEFAEGQPLADIKGIAYRDNGKVCHTKKRPFFKDIDNLPFPARSLLDREYYFSPQSMTIRGFYLRQTTFLAARGCPYKCAFCQSGQLASAGEGKYVRFHSAERVVEEIKHLVRDFNINGLLFAEDIFSIKKDNFYDTCELMIKEELHKKIKWAANLRVDTVDRELLNIMKQAGCVQIVYGCETGSQRMLDMLNKKTTVEKNYEAIRLTKESGITVESNIMVGLPDETEEDMLATIKFLKRARPDRINRGKLYPLPGTPVYKELLEKGVVSDIANWSDLWDRYVATDRTVAAITPKRFAQLQSKMDREVTYPINYMYKVKNNWKVYPLMASRQVLLMIIHCTVLYLPASIQKFARWVAGLLRVQSKYVSE